MSYSIQPEMHPYADKNQLHKLHILVIYQRMKIRLALNIKVKHHQFNGKEIVEHPNKGKLNAWLKKELNECEGRLIDLLKYTPGPGKQQLKEAVQNKTKVQAINSLQQLLQLMIDENRNTVSPGRVQHYTLFIDMLNSFRQPWSFADFNTKHIAAFHQWLIDKDYANNTIWGKFNLLKTIRTQAMKRQFIKQDPFAMYNSPGYKQKIPVYLNETETEQLQKFVSALGNDVFRNVGYYFLLSCYAGFRISDLQRFSFADRVQSDRIILRTKKTGEIVSVKIHPRLQTVLDYCKDYRLTVTDQKCNDHIKDICKMAGIKKHITMHSGRHSFAMWLAERGVSEEDAMLLMGISNKHTIGIYYRITNTRLDRVVMEKLG